MEIFNEQGKKNYNSNLGIYPIDDAIFVGHFKDNTQYREIGLT